MLQRCVSKLGLTRLLPTCGPCWGPGKCSLRSASTVSKVRCGKFRRSSGDRKFTEEVSLTDAISDGMQPYSDPCVHTLIITDGRNQTCNSCCRQQHKGQGFVLPLSKTGKTLSTFGNTHHPVEPHKRALHCKLQL